MYLFFDTETTGLPDHKKPASWEGQPRICQLGAILADQHGRVKAEMNFLVKPDGWSIPQAASAVHGITQDDVARYGLTSKGVLSILGRLMIKADRLVAHNIGFDVFMLEIECSRTGVALDLPPDYACTMENAKDLVKIPPTQKMLACGMTEFKKPIALQVARFLLIGTVRLYDCGHDTTRTRRPTRSPTTPRRDEG